VQTGKAVNELKQMFDDRSKEIVKVANASNHFVGMVDSRKAEQLQEFFKRHAVKSSQQSEDAADDAQAMKEMTKICRATADLTKELKERWGEWSAGQETTTVTFGSNTVNNGLFIGNNAGQLQGNFNFGSQK
jgi:methyl-accepting chemotaxis protein